MAAENLLAVDAAFQAGVGKKRLGHWRQQRNQDLRAIALAGIVGKFRQIQLLPDIAGECATAFGHGFHAQQHTPHIRVSDDRVGRFVRGQGTGGRPTLNAFASIGDGALVGRLGAADALNANRQAFVIHHGEHRRQAFVLFTDQPATGAVEVHHAGGRGLDAHLVFDRTATHGVGRAEGTVGIDQDFRYDKQRNALRASRRVRQFGQYQMNDVFSQVLIAPGDENLAAGDLVAAVSLRFGAGADQPQVGTGMGLGEAHGAGPAAFIHRRQIEVFQGVAGVGVQRQAGTGTQCRIQRKT
ncbi:hypothetical protein D3C72_1480900 [compost metagenome]